MWLPALDRAPLVPSRPQLRVPVLRTGSTSVSRDHFEPLPLSESNNCTMSQPATPELRQQLAAFRYNLSADNKPVDDGNPLFKGRWIDSCEDYIGEEDDDLLSLVYDGTLLTKDITICSSLEHASDIIHGLS